MSFRGDDSRRYGHVPPAQYPVAGAGQPVGAYPAQRRSSFDNGDDSGYLDQNATRLQPIYTGTVNSARADGELFITSPSVEQAPSQRQSYFPQSAGPQSSYQQQYQTQVPPPPPPSHTSYNPQHFARSQSTSLPYHPHPANRYTPSTSPTYTTPPTNYTPQAYNPAAYANTNTLVPQRHSTTAGYGNYSYGYGSPTASQMSAGYNQPPASTYSAPQPPAVAPASTHSMYDQTAVQGSHYTPTTQSAHYDPSYQGVYGAATQQYSSGSYGTNGTAATTATTYSVTNTHSQYSAPTQIPAAPVYSHDPNTYANRVSRSSSQSSPGPSPAGHSQLSPSLQRHPTNAPLPSRPMDDLPEDSEWGLNGRTDSDLRLAQDSLINDIESDLGIASYGQRPRLVDGAASEDSMSGMRRYDSNASTINNTAGSGVSRYSSTSTAVNNNDISTTYDWDSEESDPEGAAGLLAMQNDMNDQRFGGIGFPSFMSAPTPTTAAAAATPTTSAAPAALAPAPTLTPAAAPVATVPQLPSPPEERRNANSDFGGMGMDLGMYGGGYAGSLQYGNEVGSPPATASAYDAPRPLPTPQTQEHKFPPYPDVSVDYGGTGGLLPPQTHRLSFDDGDEHVSLHSRSGSDSPLKDDYQYQEMFWHPGLSSRPLPALPGGTDSPGAPPQSAPPTQPQHGYSPSTGSIQLPYPDAQSSPASGHLAAQQQQYVERSISLSAHSSTPPVQAPARSRTDATEEKRRTWKQTQHQLVSQQMMQQHLQHLQQQQLQQQGSYDGYEAGTPPSLATFDMITLPTGRRKKFVPSKLTAMDIKRCVEPWALSGIVAWIREMAEGEQDLKRKTIEEGVLRLFCAKVPTMNVADAEPLSAKVVDMMFKEKILIPEEEWVKFGPGTTTGVLWQLTGSGCYAPKLHENEGMVPRLYGDGIPVRCYSHHCGRTLKKANLDNLLSEEDVSVPDWATFHGLTAEDVKDKPKKEIERQNVLHEIVTGEEDYMGQLDVLRLLYRDQLRAYQPPIIAANRLEKFLDAVFGKVDAVQQINKEHLLAQLKYRQKEQGPWITGFSDLFREWIRKAKPIYIEYCVAFPEASRLMRKESNRNMLFRQFLEQVREHKRSKRLEWTTFIKAPITRLQRYGLLLETVKKNMVTDSEEKANLIKALEEIKAVTLECDERVAEETKKVELIELQSVLVLRPGFQSVLNLDHLGRELHKQGELQRQGSKGVRWVDTHALLFDHYFILAKAVATKTDKKYDVSKEPIPMPLLFLESTNDDPVSKQKGLTAPLTRAAPAGNSGTQLNKVASNGTERPGLDHTTTSSSIGSSVARLGSGGTDESKIIYPFRVKHLGHEIYTLYAATAQDRAAWCHAIIEAKTRHARALHVQNAEPFRLRVISDGAFAYDSASAMGRQPSVPIRGTPLDRAIREMDQVYGPGRGPPPVCRAQVNCACAFTAFGKSIIAIGTDYGVYISEASNPRGWTRSVQISRVTQIAVLEDFSVCLLIADRSLISYPLDVVAPVSNFPAPTHDNPRRAPQRLAKDVAFFATARMKERTLLFYKRKEGMHNTFKVLEPVFQKATEKKSRLFGGRSKGGTPGATESFRDFDEFYIPAECFSLNLFQTYIAVASAKGFELLTLDKKVTQSIPRDLSLPAIANIASRIKEQRPLGMFKLNDQEFLLAYEDCAVYVDKHGEISRTLIMEYSGKQKKAKAATMFGQYLVLFNEDYVEVRNAENGRLRQIIAGRDVRCLDYGFRGPTGSGTSAGMVPPGSSAGGLSPGAGSDSKGTIKICMSHPEVSGGQIVLEMLLNDGHTEKA